MASINVPELEVDCWDYVFSQSAIDRIYIGKPKNSPGGCVTERVGPWVYIIAADTPEAFRADIQRMKDTGRLDTAVDLDDLNIEPISVYELIESWRCIRYNGNKVVALECATHSPTNALAFPNGLPAPVRNGWLYVARDPDGGLIERDISNTDLKVPVAGSSINGLIEDLLELGHDVERLVGDCIIEAHCVLRLGTEYPVLYVDRKLCPLLGILDMNPAHRQDAEEDFLARLGSE
jgi:hypothetical protein